MTSKQFEKKPQKGSMTSMSDLAPAPSNHEEQIEKETKKKPRVTKRVTTKATGPALERLNWKKELKEQELADLETTKLKAQMTENQKKAPEMPENKVEEAQEATLLDEYTDKDLYMKERLIPKSILKNTLRKAVNILDRFFIHRQKNPQENEMSINNGMEFIDSKTVTQKNESGAYDTQNIIWTAKHKLEKEGKVEWLLVGSNGKSFIVSPTEIKEELKSGRLTLKS